MHDFDASVRDGRDVGVYGTSIVEPEAVLLLRNEGKVNLRLGEGHGVVIRRREVPEHISA